MTKPKFKKGDKVLCGDMTTVYTVQKVNHTTRASFELWVDEPKVVDCIEYTIISDEDMKKVTEDFIVEYHPAVQELAKRVKSLREDIEEVIKL
jgi:hypothetical protein